MPLNADPRFQLAAAMEEAVEERGKSAWIDPQRGLQIDGEIIHDAPQINHEQRATADILSPKKTIDEDVMAWDSKLATASHQGNEALADEWLRVPKHLKPALKKNLDETHKPNAAMVEA